MSGEGPRISGQVMVMVCAAMVEGRSGGCKSST